MSRQFNATRPARAPPAHVAPAPVPQWVMEIIGRFYGRHPLTTRGYCERTLGEYHRFVVRLRTYGVEMTNCRMGELLLRHAARHLERDDSMSAGSSRSRRRAAANRAAGNQRISPPYQVYDQNPDGTVTPHVMWRWSIPVEFIAGIRPGFSPTPNAAGFVLVRDVNPLYYDRTNPVSRAVVGRAILPPELESVLDVNLMLERFPADGIIVEEPEEDTGLDMRYRHPGDMANPQQLEAIDRFGRSVSFTRFAPYFGYYDMVEGVRLSARLRLEHGFVMERAHAVATAHQEGVSDNLRARRIADSNNTRSEMRRHEAREALFAEEQLRRREQAAQAELRHHWDQLFAAERQRRRAEFEQSLEDRYPTPSEAVQREPHMLREFHAFARCHQDEERAAFLRQEEVLRAEDEEFLDRGGWEDDY